MKRKERFSSYHFFTPQNTLSFSSRSPKFDNSSGRRQSITQRTEESPKIREIVPTQKYKKINKIQFSKQKMQKIQNIIKLNSISESAWKKRKSNNELYLQYEFNPFLIQTKEMSQSVSPRYLNQTKSIKGTHLLKNKAKNIIQGLNNLKNRSQFNYSKNMVSKTQSSALDLLTTIKNTQLKYKITKDKLKYMKQDKKQSIKKQQNLYIQQFQLLDAIVRKKDINYYEQKLNNQNFNIFKIIDKKILPLQYSSQILTKMNFCFDGMHKKSQKLVNQYIHFSKESRSLYKYKNKKSNLMQSQLDANENNCNIKIQEPELNEIMLIASGRLQPQTLFKIIEGDQNDREKIQTRAKQHEIIKRHNYQETQMIVQKQNQRILELNQFQKSTLNRLSAKSENITQKYYHMLEQTLNSAKECFDNNIKDIKYNQMLRKKQDIILQTTIDKAIKTGNFGKNQFKRKSKSCNKPKQEFQEIVQVKLFTKMLKMKADMNQKLKGNRQKIRLLTTQKRKKVMI